MSNTTVLPRFVWDFREAEKAGRGCSRILPAFPLAPLGPGCPGTPRGPGGPWKPRFPGLPGGPGSPSSPLGPRMPVLGAGFPGERHSGDVRAIAGRAGMAHAAPAARSAPAKRLEAPKPPTLRLPGCPLPGSPTSPFCPGLPLRPGTPGNPSLPSGARHTCSAGRAVPSTAARALAASQRPRRILQSLQAQERGNLGWRQDHSKHARGARSDRCTLDTDMQV